MAEIRLDLEQIDDLERRFAAYAAQMKAEASLYADAVVQIEQDNIALVLNELKILKAMPLSNDQADMTAQMEAADRMRTALRALMADQANQRIGRDFFDFVFGAQILLATGYPVNDLVVERSPADPETGLYTFTKMYRDPLQIVDDFEFNEEEFVATSSGHLFDKATLTNYFSRNNAFVFIDGVPHLRSPFGEVLSEREMAHLRNQGVRIPRADRALLALYSAVGLGGQRIDGQGQLVDDGEVTLLRAGLERIVSVFYVSAFTMRGILVGAAVGVLIGIALTVGLAAMAPALSPIGLALLLGTSVVAGLVGSQRPDSKGFISDTLTAIATNFLLLTATAYLAPLILTGLAAATLISSSVLTTALQSMPFVLDLVAGAALLIAGASQLLTADGMSKFYEKTIRLPTHLCIMACATVGGIMGATVGLIANCFRPALVLPDFNNPQNQDAINDDLNFYHDNNNEDQLAQNQASILSGLSVSHSQVSSNMHDHAHSSATSRLEVDPAYVENDNAPASHADFERSDDNDDAFKNVKELLGLTDDKPFDPADLENSSQFGFN